MSCTNTPVLPQPLAGELLATPLIANLATFNEDGQTGAARDLRESREFVSPVVP
jgi:hypothetical protein